MTIINMVGGGGTSGPQVPLDAISVISAVGGDTEATITWTDPSDLVVNGVTVTTWTATKLVRKVGSAPVDSTDGTLVVTETVRDTYSVSGYTDTGLTNGTTYYYAAFAVGNNGLETISSTTPSVTPAQQGWQPGANTIAYYPLDATNQLNDMSGNGYTLTNNAGYAFGTYGGVSCVSMTGDYNNSHLNSSSVPVGNTRTALARVYCTRANYNQQGVVCMGTDYRTDIIGMGVYQNKGYVTDRKTADTFGTTNIINAWHLIALTWVSGSGIKLYVDGVLETTSPNYTRSSGTGFTIGSKTYTDGGSPWSEPYKGYISEVIFENKEWSAQEISDYYNSTKGNYGL